MKGECPDPVDFCAKKEQKDKSSTISDRGSLRFWQNPRLKEACSGAGIGLITGCLMDMAYLTHKVPVVGWSESDAYVMAGMLVVMTAAGTAMGFYSRRILGN